MEEWYILIGGQTVGPVTKHTLMSYNPTSDSQVWREGMPQWQPLYTVPELYSMLNDRAGNRGNQQSWGQSGYQNNPSNLPAKMPPQNYGYQQQPNPYGQYAPYGQQPSSGKSKVIAGLLAIFFWGFGAQYFYLGKTKAGLGMLIGMLLFNLIFGTFSILTLGFGLVIYFPIFMLLDTLFLVQGIMMFASDKQKFDSKYVNSPKTFPLF